jgi:hypothetical protein
VHRRFICLCELSTHQYIDFYHSNNYVLPHKAVATSYSRRHGAYQYDIQVLEDADNSRFVAKLVNMVRMEAGDMISVDLDLHDEYGATPAEAFAKLEAAIRELLPQ